MINDLLIATGETLLMTFVSLIISYIVGILVAFICVETSQNGLFKNRFINVICNCIIAVGRAIPFVILLVLILPFTRWLVGTGIGTVSVIVPLTICAIPFSARIVETSLKKIDKWTILAAKMDNAPKRKIIIRIKLMAIIPELIEGFGMVGISIVGYTTMAGIVGGGGLGNYAITYGIQRYDWLAVLLATIIIVLIVMLIQFSTHFIAKKLRR